VAGFGIKVTLIEPTGYATDWADSSARHATALPAYEPVREQAVQARARRFTPGDPGATRDAVLQLVDGPNPPLRLFLGEAPLGIATADYESRLATWREWQPVGRSLFHPFRLLGCVGAGRTPCSRRIPITSNSCS
jgi:hypothetical protein